MWRGGWAPASWSGSPRRPSPERWPKLSDLSTPLPALHAILDVEATATAGWDASDLAQAFLDGGAPLIQLRAKRLPSAAFLALCDTLVRAAEPYRAAIIVNDRVDLALMSGAAGVHVGQDDVSPSAARQLLGPGAIVGYSTHTSAQIEAASVEPVTYIAIGPVFGTHTKATGYEPVGLALVAEAARLSRGLPVVAIGGITLDTAPQVLAAGATGVAVIGDLLTGGDPRARVAAYCRALAL
ncbi:MAG TPA: thiamine phosphate synthase [Candidatus Limnocylindrales bacterium]|nr:thiamine phosphate synthase [Candidatus Limnocylindrales bacterium]